MAFTSPILQVKATLQHVITVRQGKARPYEYITTQSL